MRHQSPRRVLRGLLLLLYFPFSLHAQCDLEILDVDLIGGYVTVAFNNTTSCGGTGGPDGVSEIQFGFQALDSACDAMNVGWDFPSGLSISDDSNHPGWIYSATTTEQSSNWTNSYGDELDPPYYAGDTIAFPLDNVYQQTSGSMYFQLLDCLQYWVSEGYSVQAVIWQISYGPTMYADNGGWAEVGGLGGGITPDCCGIYDDDNFLDNWQVVGPCGDPIPEVVYDTVYVELPADTIYLLETDTVVEYDTVLVNWYFYDTVYVELPPDTVVIYEYDTIPVAINWYFYDTTYIYITDTVLITEQVYVTQYDTVYWTVYESDTIYTYEYDMVGVDCDTGLPCVEPIPDCPIYIPNSFSPDNDGINDAWGASTDTSCWQSWSLFVYSRSGELIWVSDNPDDVWTGGNEYYVPDDIYVYRLECFGVGNGYIVHGHVTLFR